MTWQLHHADLRDVLPTLPDKSIDHVICDPPYSAHVHRSVRSAPRRVVDLGFEHLTAETRRFCAAQFARLTKRWILVFSDIESAHLWRFSLVAAGCQYVKTMVWVRVGGAPQFAGDGPASAVETITLAYGMPRKGPKRWNGGGKAGLYAHPIVANRGGQHGPRIHPTQKPLPLMVDLVTDFTEPNDTILDPFAGSGTTGVAALHLARHFVGVERDDAHAATAREQLEAAEAGDVVWAIKAKQKRLF